jgi:SAM-dependent methyltransferase
MQETNTEKLYDKTANNWERKAPNSLSDFTGRPPVFELCGNVKDLDVLDLGCGEGYCTRHLANLKPATIHGVDISEEMITLAKRQEETLKQNITYSKGNATELDFANESKDLVLAMFLFNYLDTNQTIQTFKEIYRVLKPGGHFVFAVPHPLFAFVKKENNPPFYFDTKDSGYFSGQDSKHSGEIWRRDGVALNVQLVHKRIQDYFMAFAEAGFNKLPTVKELGVKEEFLDIDREFFTPLIDIPLHMAFKIQK